MDEGFPHLSDSCHVTKNSFFAVTILKIQKNTKLVDSFYASLLLSRTTPENQPVVSNIK